jgi:hypothetical protein
MASVADRPNPSSPSLHRDHDLVAAEEGKSPLRVVLGDDGASFSIA